MSEEAILLSLRNIEKKTDGIAKDQKVFFKFMTENEIITNQNTQALKKNNDTIEAHKPVIAWAVSFRANLNKLIGAFLVAAATTAGAAYNLTSPNPEPDKKPANVKLVEIDK